MQPLISVISPVYKADDLVEELVERVVKCVSKITDNFEFLLICDGSPDNSWNEIKQCCAKDSRVKGVNLSRNFGQEYAITAGLREARGEWIVVMDCDLQDDPKEIPNLYAKAQEGYDVVFGQRVKRKDTLLKRLQSRMFYAVFDYLTDTKQSESIGNFGIFHSKVIKSMLAMNDSVRCFTTMIHWVGFKRATIPVVHEERLSGKSSYSWSKLLKLSQNIIISFSNKPLMLMVRFGFFVSLVSFLIGIDLSADFIEKAGELHCRAGQCFEVKDILELPDEPKYDYAIASGTFNLALQGVDNYAFLEQVIERTLAVCRDGFAFDFLSDKVDYQLKDTFHYAPEKVLAIAYKYSRNVVLRNDYMPFEFALFLSKNDNFSVEDTLFCKYKDERM